MIIDNIDEPTAAVTVLGTEAPDDIWAAQNFRVRGVYSLDSIEVRSGAALDPVDVIFELRAGDDPSGPPLTVFFPPALSPDSVEIVSLIPSTPVELRRGVSYWLIAGVSQSGKFGLAYAVGNNWTGTGVIGGYLYSEDRGTTWGSPGIDDPYHMRINATPICECQADFNCDGQGDFFDYLDFAAAFSSDDLSADYFPDGQIDFFDYLDFASAFDAGC
ncbi:MAG: choice-of-anchor R domain-containing protein [Planctomycetota bacterium]|nr:choice-of-anchor R domain-containing protein [Planctomycetota bacterium]